MYSLAHRDLLQNFYVSSFQHIMALHEVSTPETEMHDVQLLKNDLGLGITVAGYVCDEENISGIFIKEICTGSAADLTGNIQINDRIVKVNGKSVTALNNYQAIEILRKSGPTVIISLERYLRGPKYERLQQNVCSNPLLPSPSTETAQSVFMFLKDAECSSQEEKLCLDMTPQNTEDRKAVGISLIDNNSYSNKFTLIPEVIEQCTVTLPQTTGESSNIQNNNRDTQDVVIHVATDPIGFDQLYSVTATHNNEKESKFDNLKNVMGEEREKIAQLMIKTDSSINTDSSCIYFSKTSDDTEKDGYETCIDESLSDEVCTHDLTETIYDDVESEIIIDVNDNRSTTTRISEILTPRVRNKYFHNVFSKAALGTASSEPSLRTKNRNLRSTKDCLKWNSYTDDSLKSFNNPRANTEPDDLFLIQSVDNTNEYDFSKCVRQSHDVTNSYVLPTSVTYKCLKLQEYYNDYKDCLEEYNVISKNQDEILSDASKLDDNAKYPNLRDENMLNDNTFLLHNLSFKSYSEPYISNTLYDSEFIQSFGRRFSVLSDNRNYTTMTVTSKQVNFLEKKNDTTDFEMHWGSIKNIQICREANESLGITIVCGKVDLYTSDAALGTTSGIFVKDIVPNSAAGRSGQFHVGDRILEVDGIDLRNAVHEEAVATIRRAKNTISFVVQSLLPLNIPKDSDYLTEDTILERECQTQLNDLNKEIELIENHVEETNLNGKADEKEKDDVSMDENIQKSNKAKTAESDDEEEGTEEIKEQEIDRSSVENLKGSEEAGANFEQADEYGYILEKLRKKYIALGSTIMIVQLERGQQGLGLSLAGHKDRNCMAVFVCGLNPSGAAHRMGGIQVGDEILEVNGVVLHGRCHLNASAIIKSLAGPIFKIVILRRKKAIEDIAVRPVTQFPVSLKEEQISEDNFSVYPNVRTIAISKGNRSLGIMIIEGKHAELGQGIFISDIQEESTAEKAGLEVGEMILAVNGESLLDADYNTAASLLKRTEGLVTLILSNPSKKRIDTVTLSVDTVTEETNASPITLKTPTAPTTRATTPIPDPAADPLTCSIIPGKNNTIEIVTDNHGLGLFFVGGKDTLLPAGIVVIEVFLGGAAHKDGRIQAGDQILEANGICLKEATNNLVSQTLRQTLPKIKLVIYRPPNIEYTIIEVDLTRKPGKGLGLSVVAKQCGKGVYISEILDGGNAEIDGRITKGDLLVAVNGQNVENLTVAEVGAVLKTVSGKVVLKLHRYRPVTR